MPADSDSPERAVPPALPAHWPQRARACDVPALVVALEREAYPEATDKELREYAAVMGPPWIPGDLDEMVAHALDRDELDSEQILCLAQDLLAWDRPLPESIRRWLIEVLSDVSRRGEIPPIRAGRRPNRRLRDSIGCHVAMLDLELRDSTAPPAAVDMNSAIAEGMAALGERFAVGESRVKQIRESADFGRYLEMARGQLRAEGRPVK
jgi:hypothetical protein